MQNFHYKMGHFHEPTFFFSFYMQEHNHDALQVLLFFSSSASNKNAYVIITHRIHKKNKGLKLYK